MVGSGGGARSLDAELRGVIKGEEAILRVKAFSYYGEGMGGTRWNLKEDMRKNERREDERM